jgi:hypothetical protein
MMDANTQDQGTQGQDQGTVSAAAATANSEALPAKVYPDKASAEAAKPADAPKSLKPMEVSKAGTSVGWVLCRGYDHGLSIAARIDGYTISTGTKAAAAPLTVEAAAAKLAGLDDAALAALGLSRTPAPQPTPAPTTDPTTAPTTTKRGRK